MRRANVASGSIRRTAPVAARPFVSCPVVLRAVLAASTAATPFLSERVIPTVALVRRHFDTVSSPSSQAAASTMGAAELDSTEALLREWQASGRGPVNGAAGIFARACSFLRSSEQRVVERCLEILNSLDAFDPSVSWRWQLPSTTTEATENGGVSDRTRRDGDDEARLPDFPALNALLDALRSHGPSSLQVTQLSCRVIANVLSAAQDVTAIPASLEGISETQHADIVGAAPKAADALSRHGAPSLVLHALRRHGVDRAVASTSERLEGAQWGEDQTWTLAVCRVANALRNLTLQSTEAAHRVHADGGLLPVSQLGVTLLRGLRTAGTDSLPVEPLNHLAGVGVDALLAVVGRLLTVPLPDNTRSRDRFAFDRVDEVTVEAVCMSLAESAVALLGDPETSSFLLGAPNRGGGGTSTPTCFDSVAVLIEVQHKAWECLGSIVQQPANVGMVYAALHMGVRQAHPQSHTGRGLQCVVYTWMAIAEAGWALKSPHRRSTSPSHGKRSFDERDTLVEQRRERLDDAVAAVAGRLPCTVFQRTGAIGLNVWCELTAARRDGPSSPASSDVTPSQQQTGGADGVTAGRRADDDDAAAVNRRLSGADRFPTEEAEAIVEVLSSGSLADLCVTRLALELHIAQSAVAGGPEPATPAQHHRTMSDWLTLLGNLTACRDPESVSANTMAVVMEGIDVALASPVATVVQPTASQTASDTARASVARKWLAVLWNALNTPAGVTAVSQVHGRTRLAAIAKRLRSAVNSGSNTAEAGSREGRGAIVADPFSDVLHMIDQLSQKMDVLLNSSSR